MTIRFKVKVYRVPAGDFWPPYYVADGRGGGQRIGAKAATAYLAINEWFRYFETHRTESA